MKLVSFAAAPPHDSKPTTRGAQQGLCCGHCRPLRVQAGSQDDDCLDVTIGAPSVLGMGTVAGPKLDLQLKSSSNPTHMQDEHIAWSLKRAHYERLCHDSLVPMLLVVLMLPAESNHWLSHTPEQLILRRCAYWENLRGRGPISGNADSTTIHIPKRNVFSPESLEAMMAKIRRGEEL